jgi:hypothetical protein
VYHQHFEFRYCPQPQAPRGLVPGLRYLLITEIETTKTVLMQFLIYLIIFEAVLPESIHNESCPYEGSDNWLAAATFGHVEAIGSRS